MQTRIRARRVCYPREHGYFVPVAIFSNKGWNKQRFIMVNLAPGVPLRTSYTPEYKAC
jgi:hypothetical protein